MSKISLKHSGGNVVSLNSPTSAPTSADVAFKLPNADGSAGQYMKTDGSGNLAFATLPAAGGITMTDSWRITSDFTGDAIPITSNWERADTSPWEGYLGAGLTESSGIFTFPSTGWYFLAWKHYMYLNGTSDWNDMTPEFSNDSGSNWTAMDHTATTLGRSGVNYMKQLGAKIVDITNVSTQRMRLRVDVSNNSTLTYGSSIKTQTGFDIFRLGDT